MSKHGKPFTPADKSRITRTESGKFGHIPKDGLGAKVQHLVDSGKGAPPAAAASSRKP